MREVFVGLVTHPRSRFDVDGTATRQARDLVTALRDAGTPAQLLVSDRDDYDPGDLPLPRRQLLRSARYAADLEHRWRRYLVAHGGRPGRGALADSLVAAAMAVKRMATADQAAMVRLLNIDLSHLRVLETGVASGASWLLVLEDDARVTDIDRTAADLVTAMDVLTDSPIAFASLSESIALSALGVEGIVDGPVPGGPSWLVRASTPVTNTVCANLYRASFAADLAAGIRRSGLLPVAPIDWRVNEQVMAMVAAGRLGSQSCAWALPGLFRQGSMHG